MHEFSLCRSLVDVLLAEVQKLGRPVRVCRVRLVAGELRQIVPDSMSFAFEMLTRDTPAAGAVLEVVPAPITVRCRECDWQGATEPMQFRCGACGATAVEMLTGRELYLASFDVEEVANAGDQGLS